MTNFDEAVDYVLKWEGGLFEHESDPGGITNHGISYRTLHAIDPATTKETIRTLTVEQAKAIYKDHYWQKIYERINGQSIADYLFDMVANVGPSRAHKLFQRSIIAADIRFVGTISDERLVDDGVFGENTLDKCNILLMNHYDKECFVAALRATRASFYRSLAQNNAASRVFLNGWLKRAYAWKG
jgi:lysozyme family protein